MKHTYLILIGLLLYACGRNTENPYCENTTIAGSSNKFTELEAELLISGDTLPHINDIIIVGNCIFADMDDKNARIRIFSIDGEALGQYGKSGRAENEYSSGMSFIAQPSPNKLYLQDVNKGSISILDTDSMVKDTGNVSPRVIRTFPRVLNAFISNDTTLIYEHEVPGSYALASQNINTGVANWDETLYSPAENAFNHYHSYMVFNEKKQKIASAMRFRNQINFFDISTKKRKSVIVNTHLTKSDDDGHQYYCSVAANDSNIYALYMNQCSEDSYDVAKPMEIHVFDWEGNFIDKYRVNEYIVRIAVDKDGNIYGRDLECNVYRYPNAN